VRLPTANEINPTGDSLDGKHAERMFLGKTLEEAEGLFRENSLFYQEDLMFMGPMGFRYYVFAAINYLRSGASEGDSDMASSFAGLLEQRVKFELKELSPIAGDLASICRYMVDNYGKFKVAAHIYGDVRSRYAALEQIFLGGAYGGAS
jgi:hypothetical protein